MAVLHVTNGDPAAAALRAAGVTADPLAWRDVLHDGPVPALEPDALRAVRASFLAGEGWGEEAAIARELAERDERLAAADAVVLWFERSLLDDLQLAQILDRVDGRASGVIVDEQPFCGVVDIDLATALPQPIDSEPFRALWRAFTAPDPDSLAHPRLLEQLPWTTDGLTRSERALLAASRGATRDVVYALAQEQEERPFLGDVTAFAYLARLREGGLLDAYDRPTPFGRAVLAGDAVWEERPGLHLGGMGPGWRYDPVTCRAVAP